MTSEEVLLEKYKILPQNRKQELLDFAEFLEDIRTARNEMWGGYTKDTEDEKQVMANLVIDTHTAIWYFANSPEMSALATQTIDDAIADGKTIFLSAISIVEIIYLIDKGKLLPQNLNRLMQYLKLPNSSFFTQDLTEEFVYGI